MAIVIWVVESSWALGFGDFSGPRVAVSSRDSVGDNQLPVASTLMTRIMSPRLVRVLLRGFSCGRWVRRLLLFLSSRRVIARTSIPAMSCSGPSSHRCPSMQYALLVVTVGAFPGEGCGFGGGVIGGGGRACGRG